MTLLGVVLFPNRPKVELTAIVPIHFPIENNALSVPPCLLRKRTLTGKVKSQGRIRHLDGGWVSRVYVASVVPNTILCVKRQQLEICAPS